MNNSVCPFCNYCPTCGRRNGYGTYPYPYDQPYYWGDVGNDAGGGGSMSAGMPDIKVGGTIPGNSKTTENTVGSLSTVCNH